MQCPICGKEIPKNLYMHALHIAMRTRDVKHLGMAVDLLIKEQKEGLAAIETTKQILQQEPLKPTEKTVWDTLFHSNR